MGFACGIAFVLFVFVEYIRIGEYFPNTKELNNFMKQVWTTSSSIKCGDAVFFFFLKNSVFVSVFFLSSSCFPPPPTIVVFRSQR